MNLSQMAKKLGRRGGKARAHNLTPSQRRSIAAQGGKARAQSLQIKNYIMQNFRYLEAMDQLHPRPKVDRLKRFKRRLPGNYR